MAAPVYSADDFLGAFQALMPRGRAWPRDPDATQTKVLAALAKSPERTVIAANALLADAFPRAPVQLLPEWQDSLGLPDLCAGTSPTLDQQQAQVLARFVGVGSNTRLGYINFAANLGYSITIRYFAPFRCGRSHMGEPLGGQEWMSTWEVVCPALDAVLECEMNSVNQAHTPLFFGTT
ncbi:MAG TPA: putative phage tail protein [Nevskia sp.]|nr:putative phage tail protein [Nevskia sp.]